MYMHQITNEELEDFLRRTRGKLIDLRSKREYDEFHIEHAINIDSERLKMKSAEEIAQYLQNNQIGLPDVIVVYCNSGGRSIYFAKYLRDLGYAAYSLKGGILEWKTYHLKSRR